MNNEDVERIGRALGDPRRRELLERVAAQPGMTCTDVKEALGLSQPTISHHVSLLVEAGLLSGERAGTATRLTVEKGRVREYLQETERRLAGQD